MAVYQRGETWWYKFRFGNQLIRESAKTASKTVAKLAEQQRRRELETAYNNLPTKQDRVQTLRQVARTYLEAYRLRHRSATFADYAVGHVVRHLGRTMVVEITDKTVKAYQTSRLKEGASAKTINEEVGFLLRLLEDRGDGIRLKMRKERTLKLKGRATKGKIFDADQKAHLLNVATAGKTVEGEDWRGATRSPYIKPALALAFNTGMRNGEIRRLTWEQINLEDGVLTVGEAKTAAGEGRTIPINADLAAALAIHKTWYEEKFGEARQEWYLFPARGEGRPTAGKERPLDPTRPVSTLKTAWKNIKRRTGVEGRWHDTRHTLITELAEGGASDQTIMEIAGHVSRQMLTRYSHIRMEAKRKALEGIRAPVPTAEAQPPNS